MNVTCIIPARYNSSRFPGKPLADINGIPMIKMVWDRCFDFFRDTKQIIVATDSHKIADVCKNYDIQYAITSESCKTGTDRVAEVALSLEGERFINVQGDEPVISPYDIEKVVQSSIKYEVCCGMCPIKSEQDFRSPNIPKVVFSKNNKLLYASRCAMPTNKSLEFVESYKQVCIYGYSRQALYDFVQEKHKSPLEEIEDIEILRLLEIGYDVHMVEVSDSSISVDVPEDIEKVKNVL